VNVKIDGQICTPRSMRISIIRIRSSSKAPTSFPCRRRRRSTSLHEHQWPGNQRELLDADKARAIYEDIVRASATPRCSNTPIAASSAFTVYPIEGHSHKQVKISYTEVLKSDSGLVGYTIRSTRRNFPPH